jgi:hypothetical protein
MCVVLAVFVSVPFVSSARTNSTSVNFVNNTSRLVRAVYTSHVGADDWSGNILGSAVTAGQSVALNNISCDGDQIQLIAEDQDGCFIRTIITCGSSSTWTINDDTARDCG